MATQQAVVRRAPFRLGEKAIFLPSFKITLLNTPKLGPYYATFLVPLNLNKFDLRDYLLNGYNVRVHSVTSRILNQPVSADGNPRYSSSVRGRLFRPAPIKKMTVRLEKPFVWPDPPSEKDLEEKWDKVTFDAAEETQREMKKKQQKSDTYVDEEDRRLLSKQAQRLLSGVEKWRPPKGLLEGNFAVKTNE